MAYSFDELIDRRNTGAIKWDDPCNGEGKKDVLPLWVADMDFASPPEVAEAIRKRAEHPVFGYTNPPRDYAQLLSAWYRARYCADARAEDFLIGPGAVPSLGIAVRSLTNPGAGVLTLGPVYYPFYDIVRDNGRTLVRASLKTGEGGRFELDFDSMEAAVDRAGAEGIATEAIIFCSPHNPGGRVWTAAELESLLAFCRNRGIAVISDEVHGDIIVSGTPFTSLAGRDLREGPAVAVIGAPNKTFNIAGLHLSHFAVRDDAVRTRIKRGLAAAGTSQPNVFSVTAARAAYSFCAPWLDSLNRYLRENMDFLVSFFRERVPELSVVRPDGGYLVWVDARALIAELGLPDDAAFAGRLAEEGRVRVNFGSKFGPEGSGCLRINAACPRSMLGEGLTRMADWIDSQKKAEKA